MDSLDNRALTLIEFANNFTISNDEEFYFAGEKLLQYYALANEVKDNYEPTISKTHEAHKMSIAQMNKILSPIEKAIDIIKSKMNKRTQAVRQDAINNLKIAEAKAQEQARFEALEQAKLAPEEHQEAVFEQEFEKKQEELMPFIEEKKLNAELPKGIKVKTITRWRVVDYSQMNRSYTVPNEVMINAIVRKALKGAEAIIGGIEVYEEEEVR